MASVLPVERRKAWMSVWTKWVTSLSRMGEWLAGRPRFSVFCGLVATVVYLSVLHHSQELSTVGNALASGKPDLASGGAVRTASFEVIKGEQYRVVMQGQISSPVVLELQDSDGKALSSARLMRPVLGQPETRYWKSLKTRATVLAASVLLKMEDGSIPDLQDVIVHRLDGSSVHKRIWAHCAYGLCLTMGCLVFRRSRFAQSLALGAAYFLFLTPWNLPGDFAYTSDCKFYVPTAMSLLQRGDLDLDEFGGVDPEARFKPDYRVLKGRGGHYFNTYPVGTSLLALPMVAVGEWLYDESPDPLERSRQIAILVARLLSSATVAGVFLVIAWLSGGRTKLGLLIALVFGFATPHLAIHAGGLWSHTSTSFLSVVALALLIGKKGRYAGWAALPLCIGFACRPTMAFPGLILGLGLLMRDRRQFVSFALLSLVLGIAFVGLSQAMWGSILPPYYTNHASLQRNGFSAFIGTLVSPNRGLLIYCPIFLFALFGGGLAWFQKSPTAFFARLCGLIVVAEWVLASRNLQWWGGHSYGPRILSEALVFVMPLLIPAWDWILDRGRATKNAILLFALLCCVWGVGVNVRGLTSSEVYFWNARPNIDQNVDRLWSWRDWQIFAKPD